MAAGRLRALSPDERPRERLLRLGATALSSVELVALVLGQGRAGGDVLATAEAVVARAEAASGAAGLGRLSGEELMAVPGIGPARAAALAAAFELGRRSTAAEPARPSVADPAAAMAIVAPLLQGLAHEEFWVLCLDARHRLLARRRVGMGGPTSTPADPRAVFREAVRVGASGVVVVHNHPSGDPAPSDDDRSLTRALAGAGETLGIPLYDHLVVGGTAFYSFRSAGEPCDR